MVVGAPGVHGPNAVAQEDRRSARSRLATVSVHHHQMVECRALDQPYGEHPTVCSVQVN